MIFKWSAYSVIFIVVFQSPQLLNASGLGNYNKVFTAPTEMTQSDWSDNNEMQRTWDAALVRIPVLGDSYMSGIMAKLSQQSITTAKKFPTIIYLHGCAGIWDGTYRRINFLVRSGFAVIAPASFARNKYPQSCEPLLVKGGMYRETLAMRQNDAGYAIDKAKQLPWVDKDNVFLMGHSQGGVTTATFSSTESTMSVNARVIEGWTCHAGWQEYKGINASASEPVLALVGVKDPWFQNRWTRGDCGPYMNKKNGSKSIVYSKGPLSIRHELLEDKNAQKLVLDFLHQNMR